MNHRAISLLITLSLISIGCLLLALYAGSLSISWPEIISSFYVEQKTMAQQLVLELRLPRAAAAFITGGLLALSGALMQVLLRNPLADPYVLGISGGAAVAALIAILTGLSGLALSGSAFVGALCAMLLVFGLSHGQGSWTPTRLLLTGIVLASGWGAMISFLLAISPDQNLRSMLFWLMGDLGYAETIGPSVIVLIAGLLISISVARNLNILSQGELQAASLGVKTNQLRLLIYILASLMTATAVTLAGSIGFIGLVIPHLIRLMGFSDNRILLPASALMGGSMLILADTLSRTIIAPQQLPVGVISAAIGVPMFLFLLYRGQVHRL
ncbi:MAG: iron ABC transporter permease [Gammaproteobacteria bacterium]|nr:iron ABC transporter permease [Gammaproteobacteria bacterium]